MDSKTYKRILRYLKPYMPLIVLSLISAAATTPLSLYVPILAGNAIDYIIGPGNVDFDSIAGVLTKMAVVILLAAFFQWIMNVINNHITYSVVKDIRKKAFDHIQSLPLSYLDTKQYGDFVSRIIADTDQFSDGLLMGFSQFFTGIVMIVGTLVFMFTLNVTITIIVVVLTPLSLFVAAFIAKKTYRLFLLQSEKRAALTGIVEEMVGNEKVVQAFSYEDDAVESFDKINDELADTSLKATFFSSLTNPGTRFINNLVYAAVGIFGAIFAKFLFSSLSSCVIDLVLFYVFCRLFNQMFDSAVYVMAATIAARVLSATYNYLVNYLFVFKSGKSHTTSFPKYVALAIAQMSISAGLVTLLVWMFRGVPELVFKIPVDLILFLLSYYIQRRFVY